MDILLPLDPTFLKSLSFIFPVSFSLSVTSPNLSKGVGSGEAGAVSGCTVQGGPHAHTTPRACVSFNPAR